MFKDVKALGKPGKRLLYRLLINLRKVSLITESERLLWTSSTGAGSLHKNANRITKQ